VEIQISRLNKLLEAKHLSLKLTPEASNLLAELGFDPVFGVRPLKRVMEKMLVNTLSQAILKGEIVEGDGEIRVERDGEKLIFKK
jgi:ATP-dependent Clp protease ATP-binding subunit ClpB